MATALPGYGLAMPPSPIRQYLNSLFQIGCVPWVFQRKSLMSYLAARGAKIVRNLLIGQAFVI